MDDLVGQVVRNFGGLVAPVEFDLGALPAHHGLGEHHTGAIGDLHGIVGIELADDAGDARGQQRSMMVDQRVAGAVVHQHSPCGREREADPEFASGETLIPRSKRRSHTGDHGDGVEEAFYTTDRV